MTRYDQIAAILVVAYSAIGVAGSNGSSRPRGVGPDFAKYYKDLSTFSCISNPSIKLPFSSVNDDYCDCPDGSDEPGTSACSHISRLSPSVEPPYEGTEVNRTPALPGFYCPNKGHRPSYVPFIRVNDGICDYDNCCDGSDEWAQVGGKRCENRCKEIGKAWNKQEEQKRKSWTAAIKKRKELVEEASRLRREVEDRIKGLEAEQQTAEAKVKSLEIELEEIRASERSKIVKGKKKGRVNILAGLAKDRVEELRKALINVRKQRDERNKRLEELEAILGKFKQEYNPNFNDEGVKRAVRSWEEYAARKETENSGVEIEEGDIDEISKQDGESSGIHWEKWENEKEGKPEIELIYKIAAYLPNSVISFIEDKFADLRSFLISQGVIADNSGDGESGEPKAVTEARNRLKDAESSLKSTRSQLKDRKADLEADYGRDSVFRPIKGKCVSKDSGEYTYELCWLEKTKQRSKTGGSLVGMGDFSKFTTVTVDELAPSGEITQKERVALEYDRGQSCWNGPQRSTKVILECGENDAILKIAEDEKCVYSMHATTPAVCETSSNNTKAASSEKDEL